MINRSHLTTDNNPYDGFYFVNNATTVDIINDIYTIVRWYNEPSVNKSPFDDPTIYVSMRFTRKLLTTEFSANIYPFALWYNDPTKYPSPYINKPEEKEVSIIFGDLKISNKKPTKENFNPIPYSTKVDIDKIFEIIKSQNSLVKNSTVRGSRQRQGAINSATMKNPPNI